MTFNLIHEAWLPVRRASGQGLWLKPADITGDLSGDPIVALDFPRPDWNAAIIEFLIGLLPARLRRKTRRIGGKLLAGAAFPRSACREAGADRLRLQPRRRWPPRLPGPRFRSSTPEKGNSQLLIDAPGANAIIKNTDHFINGSIEGCPWRPMPRPRLLHCRPMPLRRGVNSSLIRGVGPLTTLVESAASAKAGIRQIPSGVRFGQTLPNFQSRATAFSSARWTIRRGRGFFPGLPRTRTSEGRG